ncbi:F-box domain-containing protein [Mycena sanguinolenta]|uniref:F-box domain-containing protein n=1 Tax=Mycena sanguinolenta TaxID=230812 RepID=A0A8H6Z2E6_9AGAR|nr:F-box domain-containing protein [Mycena sanguinolenta]
MAIPMLPTDIILVILKYIGVKDLMRLRQTCKDFLQITQLRTVWHELLQREVIERNIPIPRLGGRNLAALTVKELESCLADALRLRKNWISSSPVPAHSMTFQAVQEPQSQVVSLAFLPTRNRRCLISLSLRVADGHRIFTLQCWVLTSLPTCIARRTLSDFRGFRINTDPTFTAAVALRSSTGLEILAIDFSSSNPDSGFVTLQTLDNVDHSLQVFCGSMLLTKFGDARIGLRTVENPSFCMELQNPSHTEQNDFIDAIVTDKYAVIVRTATLDFYSLSSFRAGSAASVIEPITSHTWQWRIDSVSLAYQPSWETRARAEPPINILVRYASLFPWPVNALHHYVLPCDGTYDCRIDIDTHNKPYLAAPILIRTFASPIRLFARWDMVLGAYGTALWIDSHTEDYFDHAVEGQRLAGTLFTTVEDGAAVVPLDERGISATASMVYQVREDDGWVRIAIEEEEGEIAVGTSTAEITIFRYI